MSDSSVPNIVFTPTGVVLPLESEILAGVQADMNAAFGGQLNPALETPQGQLASSTAAIIGDKNNVFAEFVSQVDPDVSSGVMQDAIGRIYFLNRKPALPTVVTCTCGGVAGTVIPAASLAIDTNGNIYSSSADATIGVGGTVEVNFACAVTGAIPCPAGALNQIYRSVGGWETVVNDDAGVTGLPVESRADFEFRRRQSVALNAHGTLPSIYAAVFNLDDVSDVYAIDNVSNEPVIIGATNYELAPHSLYVAVTGGVDTEIAQAIWDKKDVGCDYNGDTEVIVTDDSYSYPQPQYTVKFQRPDITPVLFLVRIAQNSALPANISALIKAAIIAAFSGTDGGSRARIGGTIFASRFYGGISQLSPVVEILEVLIGIDTPSLNAVTLGIDQAPTVSNADITVLIGG